MSNRAVAPVFAVLLSSLASMALTTSTIAAPAADDQTATAAADDCLASPKTETPKGSHWFYRLEKGTKRKCWYLGDATSKAAKTSTATTPAPRNPEPDAGKKPTAMQPVVANARAEMTAAQPSQASADDAKLNESIWPPMPDQSANAASNDTSEADSATADAGQQTAVSSANAQNWNISQRWPDQNSATTSGASSDKTRPSATPAAQTSTPPTSTTDKTTAAAANSGILSNTTPMLIIMLVAALIFAAIAGRMIIKYANRGSQKKRSQRRDIWGDYNKPEESATDAAFESAPPWTDFDERPLRAANDPSDEIEKLLSRAAKRSAA